MDLPVRSREARALVGLILESAKQTDQTARTTIGTKLPRAESVLLTAVRMARNTGAVAELARRLHIEPEKAHQLLGQCRDAAAALASEAGFLKISDMVAPDREAADRGAGSRNGETLRVALGARQR
jgi:hypothetical protein